MSGMKTLHAEHSNFARQPAIEPTPTDLNRLVADTVAMYEEQRAIELEKAVQGINPTAT